MIVDRDADRNGWRRPAVGGGAVARRVRRLCRAGAQRPARRVVHGAVFAASGTGIIVFECLLGLRKKYPGVADRAV